MLYFYSSLISLYPMSWLSHLFKRKAPVSTTTYAFTDEDREAAAEKKRMAALMRKQNDILEDELNHLQQLQRQQQKKEQIEQLKSMIDDYDGTDDDDFDDEEPDEIGEVVKGLVAQFIGKMNTGNSQEPTQTVQVSRSLSDEQIKAIISSVPSKYLSQAKRMDDEKLRAVIISFMPNIDANSVNRAIPIIRGT